MADTITPRRKEWRLEERNDSRRELLRRAGIGAAVIVYGAAAAAQDARAGAPKYRHKRARRDAADRPVEPLRAGLRQVVRRHLRQAVGRGQRHRGDRRPHQPGRHPGTRRGRGRRAERARPVLASSRRRRSTRTRSINHNDVVQEVTKKRGKMADVAHRSTYNPRRRSTSRSRTTTRPTR